MFEGFQGSPELYRHNAKGEGGGGGVHTQGRSTDVTQPITVWDTTLSSKTLSSNALSSKEHWSNGTLVGRNIGRMEHWSNETLVEWNIGRTEHSSNG